MKKIFLTLTIAFMSAIYLSAQDFLITVGATTDVKDEYSLQSLTDNIGFWYKINSELTFGKQFLIGISLSDARIPALVDSSLTEDEQKEADKFEAVGDMQLFARYYHTDNLFGFIMTPFDSKIDGIDPQDMLRVGIGYTMKVWNNINAEAGFSTRLNNSDSTVEEGQVARKKGDAGELMIGLSMSF